MTEPAPTDEPIERLREQIRAATDAAERLVREAGGASPPPPPPPPPPPRPGERPGAAGRETPASGWEVPDRHADAASELRALSSLFATVRELLPEELAQQVTELIRQLLLVLRALIDWAVTRIERGPPGRDLRVEEIPIA